MKMYYIIDLIIFFILFSTININIQAHLVLIQIHASSHVKPHPNQASLTTKHGHQLPPKTIYRENDDIDYP